MRRSLDEARWVLISAVVALAVEVLLRTTKLSTTSRALRLPVLTVGSPAPFRTEPLPRWAGPRLRAVDRVANRWPWGDTCLRRSLLTAAMIRPVAPLVRIGWLPTPQGGNAHAWVEVAGRSLETDLDGVLPFSVA